MFCERCQIELVSEDRDIKVCQVCTELIVLEWRIKKLEVEGMSNAA